MSLLNSARYDFGLELIRLQALNPDFTVPKVTRIVGGAGPFDFTDAAAWPIIPFSFKTDNGSVISDDIDLTAAADQTAVTVAEIVTAFTTAAPTNLTAEAEAVTGYLKISLTVPGSAGYLQFYGELAELTNIGQGLGVKFVKGDTFQTSDETIVRKDDEQITNTDAKGRDIEIDTDGYRKGVNFTITDTAGDYEIRELIEGGVIDSDGNYNTPTILSERRYFYLELFAPRYTEGTHKERDIAGYVQQIVYSCKGTFGDRSRGRAWVNWIYNVTATTFKDETDTLIPDSKEILLSVAEYEALAPAEV